MNNKVWLILLFSSCSIFSKNQFMGIIEDGSVKKNNFLCPLSLNASGNVVCNNMDTGMRGFDISGGHTIQIFNNQQYWLQQKFERQQLLIVQNYSGDRLTNAMTQEGWDHMGAFSIIISTDPILAKAIESATVSGTGQIKLIVQLWYSSSTGLELWAQDVKLLNAGQNFTILVSNNSSKLFTDNSSVNSNPLASPNSSSTISATNLNSSLPSLSDTASGGSFSVTTSTKQTAPTTLSNFKQQFLEQVGFAPSYIDKNVYNAAYGSPRNIQIQVQ